ncbi:hypothetical protein AUEXF2481DRAFT_540111 [Aureobasidium subglaciale EXF-2481]|uniref:Uncharacterized protein n=1 Tax=Aureobasidium subglaciale (strain EXF-2481) TaxID=1043005 RepID=A0A074YJ26_AURSE|nr:uncharacterized protein AUEXF2481DRAFT_540111 [Aureobasidium subglaciale EXF-2481]KAI5196039.1 hypothetical protein E4T38_08766 [Aureobasidium subglaciale]KAI5215439.1 hypothetical protein E4T40_08431 [Aureobasidium subglaciale]KAI5217946.1 hypothetical protein E4T41_08590 [Aureobasidium subglaciale]KAI5255606.1 hypothetical protein E4T46_08667 [Aureobasidium subglaciale]KEQ97675.1 hypothetical protein AUEXF2481DRAFT_540111 [Aureobasidium subglaciale EXF-2481]
MSDADKQYSQNFTRTTENLGSPSVDHSNDAQGLNANQALNTDELFDDPTYPDAAPDELLPPPDFRPFFTLIEDPDTGEHHHPSVHYIFSDDNPDVVTSTIVEGIDRELANAPLEKRPTNKRERMILLDIAPDGKTVNEAQSLSPHWQILKTTVGQAPSWADEVSRKDIPGLMLNIQGMESHKLKLQSDRPKGPQEDIMARVEAMIGGYSDCLSTLEGLVKRDVLKDEEGAPVVTTDVAATHDD